MRISDWLTLRNVGIMAALLLLVVLYRCLPREIDAKITDVTLVSLRPAYGDYYLTAKVTNTGTKPLVLPVFGLGIDSYAELNHTAIGLIVAPGETTILCCGGQAPPNKLRLARAGRVRLLYSDPYTPEEFVEEQLRLRPKLNLVVSSLSYSDGYIMLQVRFDNNTGQEISEVRATAIGFDSSGAFVGASSFRYFPAESYPKGVRIDAIPGMISATKCVVQIDMFQKRGKSLPKQVPVAPSVH